MFILHMPELGINAPRTGHARSALTKFFLLSTLSKWTTMHLAGSHLTSADGGDGHSVVALSAQHAYWARWHALKQLRQKIRWRSDLFSPSLAEAWTEKGAMRFCLLLGPPFFGLNLAREPCFAREEASVPTSSLTGHPSAPIQGPGFLE